MHILGISHIGIAAREPDKAQRFFQDILGLPVLAEELVAEQKTHTTTVATRREPSKGDTSFELLRPLADQSGPIARFMERRGGGVHHIALRVADIEASLVELRAMNVRLIDESPRRGANHARVAFIHPDATGGILVELVEEQV